MELETVVYISNTPMRKFFLLLTISTLGCIGENQSSLTVSGEIYIKLIDVYGSMYGMPRDDIENALDKIRTGVGKDSLSSSELEVRNYYEYLAQENLIDQPYFKMKTKKGKIINVFTSEEEYSKLKPNLENLDRDKEKIVVKVKGKKMKKGIFYAQDIVSIEKLKGKTDWTK